MRHQLIWLLEFEDEIPELLAMRNDKHEAVRSVSSTFCSIDEFFLGDLESPPPRLGIVLLTRKKPISFIARVIDSWSHESV